MVSTTSSESSASGRPRCEAGPSGTGAAQTSRDTDQLRHHVLAIHHVISELAHRARSKRRAASDGGPMRLFEITMRRRALSETGETASMPSMIAAGEAAHGVQADIQQPVAAEQDDGHEDPAHRSPRTIRAADAAASASRATTASPEPRLSGGRLKRPLVHFSRHALTSGTFGTVRTPPPPLPPDPFGFTGLFRLRRGATWPWASSWPRSSTTFSGFGFTGPSGYSKPRLSQADLVRLDDDAHRAAVFSRPNSTSSASGVLMVDWIRRAIGRAPMARHSRARPASRAPRRRARSVTLRSASCASSCMHELVDDLLRRPPSAGGRTR